MVILPSLPLLLSLMLLLLTTSSHHLWLPVKPDDWCWNYIASLLLLAVYIWGLWLNILIDPRFGKMLYFPHICCAPFQRIDIQGFHLIILMQPPEDVLVLSLMPGDVVEFQSMVGCRGRSKAVAIIGIAPSMRSPSPACWGFCLQGASVASPVVGQAGDWNNLFAGGKLQSFFFAGSPSACLAPGAPLVVVPGRNKMHIEPHLARISAM